LRPRRRRNSKNKNKSRDQHSQNSDRQRFPGHRVDLHHTLSTQQIANHSASFDCTDRPREWICHRLEIGLLDAFSALNQNKNWDLTIKALAVRRKLLVGFDNVDGTQSALVS
jgi:hypothetical protein